MDVFYDENCPLCNRTRKWIDFIKLRSIQWQPLESAQECGLDHKSCFEQMHVIYKGNTYSGFYAVRILLLYTYLFFLVPMFYLPGVPWLGQRVYLFIAKRRYSLFK